MRSFIYPKPSNNKVIIYLKKNQEWNFERQTIWKDRGNNKVNQSLNCLSILVEVLVCYPISPVLKPTELSEYKL